MRVWGAPPKCRKGGDVAAEDFLSLRGKAMTVRREWHKRILCAVGLFMS